MTVTQPRFTDDPFALQLEKDFQAAANEAIADTKANYARDLEQRLAEVERRLAKKQLDKASVKATIEAVRKAFAA